MSEALQGKRTLCRDCRHAKLAGWPGLRCVFGRWCREFALCKARSKPGRRTYNHWTGAKRMAVTDGTHHYCATVNRDLHCPHFEEKPVASDETYGCHTRFAAAHGVVFWQLVLVVVVGLAGLWLL